MPFHVTLRFYEELNEYLTESMRKKDLLCPFDRYCTAGELIKKFGVPLDAIDLLLINGESMNFSHALIDNDRISVYPVFESFDISTLTSLSSRPLRNLRFIVDEPLGKLSEYLRMLGFDTIYPKYNDKSELIALSVFDKRIILTSNQSLIADSRITHGYRVQQQLPLRQLHEVIERFDMATLIKPGPDVVEIAR